MPPVTPDTIAAIATAPGRAAVSIVRLSGPDTACIATAILGGLPPPRVASWRRFLGEDGGTLDTGLAVYFPAPHSFTGEAVLELHGHGGVVAPDQVLRRVLALGARLAQPGEFTERAFLNGKLDLAQAEAVADLIDAGSAAAARAAIRSLQGEFSAHIHRLQSQLTEFRVFVEVAIDFPDEEIDFLPNHALRERVARVFAAFDAITAAARQGALLREGLNVVIAGKPNAGKSSLLNRLAGDDIAIVTPFAGTTRDVLREQVQLGGLPVNFIDTAGLRPAADAVEEEGIRRAWAEIRRADHVLYVEDASLAEPLSLVEAASLGGGATPVEDASAGEQALPAEFQGLPPAVAITRVKNKIDLPGLAPRMELGPSGTRIYLSAYTGAGLDLLRTHLQTAAGYRDAEAGVFSARRRHLDALSRARQCVQNAADSLRSSRAFELCAEDLRLAQRHLSEITGEFTSEDLLGQIFGSFCIGK
jgi:tRNA modification GTPase